MYQAGQMNAIGSIHDRSFLLLVVIIHQILPQSVAKSKKIIIFFTVTALQSEKC